MMMRIQLVLLSLFLIIQLQANDLKAQRLTLHANTMSLENVLKEVTKQTGYDFLYNSALLKKYAVPVTLSQTNKPLADVLQQLFEAQPNLTYTVDQKTVVVRPKRVTIVTPKQQQQQRQVKGKVTNESGEPVVGASVVEKGTTNGTTTDDEGLFTLEGLENSSVLQISFVGYKPREILVNELGFIDAVLESESSLDEVVVVGAGTQKKISVTGAITIVKGSELRAPSASLTSNMAGKLAGVVSVASSGEPGAVSQFYIRGISTFGGRAEPLILLDGVEISIGDLDRLPTESIESFSILKDASATAIYGARGANGVMLVTTKQGKENTSAEIRASFDNSFFKPVNQVKFADGVRYMEVFNDAEQSRYPGNPPTYSDETIEYTRSGINPYVYPNVDWMDMLFKKYNMNQRANVNVQGGANRVTYYMGLQANHTTGLIDVPEEAPISSNHNQWDYVFQSNVGYKITPSTKVDLRINAQVGKRKGPGTGTQQLFNEVKNINPVIFPAWFPAEPEDRHIRFGNTSLSGQTNPYTLISQSQNERDYNTINTVLNLEQDLKVLTEGLSISSLINFKSLSESSFNRGFKPFYYEIIPGSWYPGEPDYYELRSVGNPGDNYIWWDSDPTRFSDNTFYFDTRLNYKRSFGEHNLTAMGMYMMREFKFGGFANNVLPKRNQGISGRLTYDYKNKYLTEFNFGYNGTERLAKGERFEFFPALSLGWVLSNEPFWQKIEPVIDHFKIRASYGIVGSDETGLGAGRFLYVQEVDMGGYGFQTGANWQYGYGGPKINTLPIQNAHWERSKKFNLGLDLSLLRNINATLEYFREHRDRILLSRGSFPSMLGYSTTPWSNTGEVNNQGFEVSLNWNKEIATDLHIDLRGNFTYNRAIIEYKDEPAYPYIWQISQGKPMQRTDGYIALGLFRSEEEVANSPDQSYFGGLVQPGDIKYQDVNGDGIITDEDKVMTSPYGEIPRIQYGFGINLVYKKWDLGAFFTGSAQRTLSLMGTWGGERQDIQPFANIYPNLKPQLLEFVAGDYWSPSNPNPNAAFPRLGVIYGDVRNNSVESTFWNRNGSFLRFKTLEMGYTFSRVRVYFTGDNLAVWSPFKHWDPALWWNQYPLSRTFNIGAQFKF